LIALAPVPATVDWLTQSVGKRESTNLLRFVTGALLGFAFADVLALLWFRSWLFFLGAALVFLTYSGAIVLILLRAGALRRVVAEHFPEVAS